MKKKVAIIFGGCSSEYNVSLVSATSVIRNINKNKYDVIMTGVFREGQEEKRRQVQTLIKFKINCELRLGISSFSTKI